MWPGVTIQAIPSLGESEQPRRRSRPGDERKQLRFPLIFLSQDASVSNPACDALSVEVLEQREHRTTAGAHAIAQLSDGDGAAVRDYVFHDRDRRLVSILRKCDVVADPDDVTPLCQRSNDFRAGAGLLDRLGERRRS